MSESDRKQDISPSVRAEMNDAAGKQARGPPLPPQQLPTLLPPPWSKAEQLPESSHHGHTTAARGRNRTPPYRQMSAEIHLFSCSGCFRSPDFFLLWASHVAWVSQRKLPSMCECIRTGILLCFFAVSQPDPVTSAWLEVGWSLSGSCR